MAKIINSINAPSPIGPYSQAVFANNMLYVSGQIALDPETGQLILETISKETNQVMENILAILKEAKMDFSNIVKTTIFITSMDYFTELNEVYGKYFSNNYPARETVAVKALPKNVNVEISVIAIQI